MESIRTRRVCPPALANGLFLTAAGAYVVGLFGRMSYAAVMACLLYTSPSPRDGLLSRMPSSA